MDAPQEIINSDNKSPVVAYMGQQLINQFVQQVRIE